jgi:hypothetical protein
MSFQANIFAVQRDIAVLMIENNISLFFWPTELRAPGIATRLRCVRH